ncbi:MAG: TraR/DksA C4-type zinc finger protein [Candidatus Parcubacteria bacterium]|nr:TraR/DksA C4-type zinc finger protein [Candidatus Parcubacteria bacterium]
MVRQTGKVGRKNVAADGEDVKLAPERPLGKREVENYRKLLLTKLAEAQVVYEAEVGNINGADLTDQARQETDLAELLRNKEKARREIILIRAALDRMDEDEFGICQECGEQIPRKRLESQPTAKYCMPCKTAREVEEKSKRSGRGYYQESLV